MPNPLYYGDDLHVLRGAAAVGVWENEYLPQAHAVADHHAGRTVHNKRPDIPWIDTSAQKKAKREDTKKQGKLL